MSVYVTYVHFHSLSVILLSPSNLSELKKEPCVINVVRSQGKHGLTTSPQPKFLTQHPLQKQGNNTDQSQDVRNCTTNGVVAQNRLECRDSRLPVRNDSTAIQSEDASSESGLVNGERESTSTDSLQTTAACKGQTINSCCRTSLDVNTFPSGKETVEMIANAEDKQVEEHIKQDQQLETKVRGCIFCAIPRMYSSVIILQLEPRY